MDDGHGINATFAYILMGCKSNEKLFYLSLSEEKSKVIEMTANRYKNAILESSPNIDKNNVIVYNDTSKSGSRMSRENSSNNNYNFENTLFYGCMYCHISYRNDSNKRPVFLII